MRRTITPSDDELKAAIKQGLRTTEDLYFKAKDGLREKWGRCIEVSEDQTD